MIRRLRMCVHRKTRRLWSGRASAAVHWCVIHAQAEQVLLQGGVGGESRHAAAMRDPAVVHHRDRVAQPAGEGEVLLDHQQGGLAVLQLAEGVDHVGDDRRRQALGRLVDQQQAARLDDGAGHRQHLLLAAREMAGRQAPEALQRLEAGEDPVEPLWSGGPARAASTRFSCTVRSAKIAMLSGT